MSDVMDAIQDFEDSMNNEYILLQNTDHGLAMDFSDLKAKKLSQTIENYEAAARGPVPEHLSKEGLLMKICDMYTYQEFIPDDFERRPIRPGDIIGFHEMWEDTQWYYYNSMSLKRLWNFPEIK